MLTLFSIVWRLRNIVWQWKRFFKKNCQYGYLFAEHGTSSLNSRILSVIVWDIWDKNTFSYTNAFNSRKNIKIFLGQTKQVQNTCKIINFFLKNILENYSNFLINNIHTKTILFFYMARIICKIKCPERDWFLIEIAQFYHVHVFFTCMFTMSRLLLVFYIPYLYIPVWLWSTKKWFQSFIRSRTHSKYL